MKPNRVCQAVLSLVFMSWVAAVTAGGEIYKWVDAKGVVHYSDTAPETLESAKALEPLVLPELNTLDSDHLSDFPSLAGKAPRSPIAKLIGQSPARGQSGQGDKRNSADAEYSEPGLQHYRWIPYGYPYVAGYRHHQRCQGQWRSKGCKKAGRLSRREQWRRAAGQGFKVSHRAGHRNASGLGRSGRRLGVVHGLHYQSSSLRLTVRP